MWVVVARSPEPDRTQPQPLRWQTRSYPDAGCVAEPGKGAKVRRSYFGFTSWKLAYREP